jgi:uncharacterized protein YjdB
MKRWLSLAGIFLASCIGLDEVFDEIPIDDLSKIEVTPDNLALMVNESATLMATYYNAFGMEANTALDWASTDMQIVSVDNAGRITALQPGSCRITVTANNNPDLTAETMVNVVSDPTQVGIIDIEAPSTTIAVNGMIQLVAIAKNVAGEEVEGIAFTWESMDENVLEVMQNGKVTGKANGDATVTASAQGITSPPLKITVGKSNTRTGAFKGLGGYTVKGTASLSTDNLSFSSDFSADNGPGLFVYLTKASNSVTGGVELGTLSSTNGGQSYSIPSNVDSKDFGFVLIYCKPFGIPFGIAELEK